MAQVYTMHWPSSSHSSIIFSARSLSFCGIRSTVGRMSASGGMRERGREREGRREGKRESQREGREGEENRTISSILASEKILDGSTWGYKSSLSATFWRSLSRNACTTLLEFLVTRALLTLCSAMKLMSSSTPGCSLICCEAACTRMYVMILWMKVRERQS